MPLTKWRPASEAEAAGARAVFLEWLRAVRGVDLPGPMALAAWRRAEPAGFAAAMADFAGLQAGCGVRAALLHGHGARAAWRDGSTVWSRAHLLAAPHWPAPLAAMLERLAPADLPELAASHLLDHGTTPDAILPCVEDQTDPWPLGAWLLGASLRRA